MMIIIKKNNDLFSWKLLNNSSNYEKNGLKSLHHLLSRVKRSGRFQSSAVSGVQCVSVHKFSECRKSAIHLNNSYSKSTAKALYKLAHRKKSSLREFHSLARFFAVCLRVRAFLWIFHRLFRLMCRFSHSLRI